MKTNMPKANMTNLENLNWKQKQNKCGNHRK